MLIKLTPFRKLFPKETAPVDEDNYYKIYWCNVNEECMDSGVVLNDFNNISILGDMPELSIHKEYVAELESDKQVGSYKVKTIRQEAPKNITEQKLFLLELLTPLQVENIYKVYSENDDVVDLITKNEFDYSKVDGLGEVRYGQIRDRVLENFAFGETIVTLSKLGIKFAMMKKLITIYGSPEMVIEKIKKNPYILTEVSGIGFKKADEIAMRIGISATSDMRIESCIHYILEEEESSGHSWTNKKQIIRKAVSLLEIESKYVVNVTDKEIRGITKIKDHFARDFVFSTEEFVAEKLLELQASKAKIFDDNEIRIFLKDYCSENNIELTEDQKQYFYDFNENSVTFLVANAGSGKSFIQLILLEFLSIKGYQTLLTAPTGRASKVLSNYTSRQAMTIHRALGRPDGDSQPLDYKIVLVDETSMCDIFLIKRLLQRIKKGTKIIFIGDDFQLPSVKVGNFLYDCINSGSFKISRLNKIFRQQEGGILNVATDVRMGKKFLNPFDSGKMTFGKDTIFHLANSKFLKDGYMHYYKLLMKKIDEKDITVLTPTNKGPLGTISINKEIQKLVNPPSRSKTEKIFGKDDQARTFREGDLVMNIVNKYDVVTVDGIEVDVFNGDTGKIKTINLSQSTIVINIDGFDIIFSFSDMKSFVHAWSITNHKSQGSGIKGVIMIIDKSHTYQLDANILYTAETRAKGFLIVLTQADTFNKAMSKVSSVERRSFLKGLLNQTVCPFQLDTVTNYTVL